MNNEKNLYVDEYPNPRYVDTHRLYPVLTKREYFAAMALHGMLANSDLVERMIQSRTAGTTMESYYAEEAIKQADALIKELGK